MHRSSSQLWVLLLCACHGPELKPTELGNPSPALNLVSLELRMAKRDDGGWQSVMPGATLQSGTEFSVNVTAGQTAYVYVGQRSGNAEVSLVFPGVGQAPVAHSAGRMVSIPAAGQWFRVDDRPGRETLFALVSSKPHEPQVAQRLLLERADSACAKTRDPPPPEVKVRDRGSAVSGMMGDDGLVVLCFPFVHE